MISQTRILLLAILAGWLQGCQPPQPPQAMLLTQGMADVLIDTGLYAEVGITQTIGHHYRPGDDSWDILACYRFMGVDGSQGSNCIDSFRAFETDNGKWVVSVTVEGIYRWRAITLAQDPRATLENPAPQGAAPASVTQQDSSASPDSE